MKVKKSHQERLKKMKKTLEENQHILDSEFPDNVTHVGSPDLTKKEDKDIDEDFEDKSDEE
ncbi:hypothetical protein [Microbulbifer halophilus]|uniref:Uncharacterized protein n=1 Tax=Microbulbifer halophilus TaxID=453963 RepID=A0ABW5EDM1_9GAMM|nr:hypothetical protein [Microbulbifer halophilus]MCW8125056.1 hypothetical protein [Microbulbifer halophilus]